MFYGKSNLHPILSLLPKQPENVRCPLYRGVSSPIAGDTQPGPGLLFGKSHHQGKVPRSILGTPLKSDSGRSRQLPLLPSLEPERYEGGNWHTLLTTGVCVRERPLYNTPNSGPAPMAIPKSHCLTCSHAPRIEVNSCTLTLGIFSSC